MLHPRSPIKTKTSKISFLYKLSCQIPYWYQTGLYNLVNNQVVLRQHTTNWCRKGKCVAVHLDPVQQSCHSSIFSSDWISGRRASQGSVQWKQGFSDVHESPIYIGLCPENADMFVHDKFDKFQLANIVNKIIRE